MGMFWHRFAHHWELWLGPLVGPGCVIEKDQLKAMTRTSPRPCEGATAYMGPSPRPVFGRKAAKVFPRSRRTNCDKGQVAARYRIYRNFSRRSIALG